MRPPFKDGADTAVAWRSLAARPKPAGAALVFGSIRQIVFLTVACNLRVWCRVNEET
jgi:hypothetical protein